MSLVVSFVLVVGVVGGSAWWLNTPNYALLFADMDEDAAGQVVTRLKSMKVPYSLDEGGRAIRVPATRVDELRLDLTAQGLPSSGRVGFEIFDRTAFGATEFLEKVNYRRALEGEIARTISTIAEVGGARVHIAMGKDSLFGEPRPAKASVVLKLREGRSCGVKRHRGHINSPLLHCDRSKFTGTERHLIGVPFSGVKRPLDGLAGHQHAYVAVRLTQRRNAQGNRRSHGSRH